MANAVTLKKEVDAWSQELPPTYQRCRDKGHDMEGRQARKAGTGFWRRLVCTRCQFEYQEDLDRQGRVIDKYGAKYPDGYLAPKGILSLADRGDVKAAVRLVSLKRLVNETRHIQAVAEAS